MKQNIFVPTVFICAAILFADGCSKKSEPPMNSTQSESKPKSAETEPPPPPGMDVFNTFDQHNKFDNHTAWSVMNNKSGYRGQAEWFIPKNSGPLNFVDMAMSGKGSIDVMLAEDNNGIPGKILENFQSISISRFARNGHLILVSKIHPPLSNGIRYWLCIEPASAGTDYSWFYNNQNLTQGFAFERGQGNWMSFSGGPRNGAFRINVLNE
jgi:hypothetical protein